MPAAEYARLTDVAKLRTDLAASGAGTASVHWDRLAGIPEDFGAGLREVVHGTAFTGKGTSAEPLALAPAAIAPDRLAGCPTDGQILKFVEGQWQCASDVGSGNTLSCSVTAPLEQQAGAGSAPATLRIAPNGIGAGLLAIGAVGSAQLALDAASLGKVSQGALTAADGAVGVGVQAPTARLEVSGHPEAGVSGPGNVTYTSGTSVALTGASFTGLLRVGDSIQFGGIRPGAP